MSGWTWFITSYKKVIDEFGILSQLSDEELRRLDAQLAGWFGEALLPAMSAFLLGLDVLMHLLSNEFKRLFYNLGNLFAASTIGFVTYLILSDHDAVRDAFVPFNSDAYAWIGTGYLFIAAFSLCYLVLFVLTCCTCNCKDTVPVRLCMALGLIVGGVVASIGYWIYASEFDSGDIEAGGPYAESYTLYYIGMTVAVGGFPILWALDIAVKDIKK